MENKFFLQIENYLKANCADTLWLAKMYLPAKMFKEYAILHFFEDWDDYQVFLTSLRAAKYDDARIEEYMDNFIDSRLNGKSSGMKFSICHKPSKEVIEAIEEKVKATGFTFAKYLFALIKEKKMKEVEVYKKAHIDRRIFSKIRKDKFYMPSKQTVLMIAFAMELNLQETLNLLEYAGYTLSKARREDVIVQYFLDNKMYDMFLMNEVLIHFGCPTIGV